MRLSQALLDAVEAALPGAGEAGLKAHLVQARIGGWHRTTVRHALRELIRQGRAGFYGRDHQRRYRRVSPGESSACLREPEQGSLREARPEKPPSKWRAYGARGDDANVILPDAAAVSAVLRAQRIRYRDVEAADLRREERMAQWSLRPRTSAELTRAVFGDPAPGRGAAKA